MSQRNHIPWVDFLSLSWSIRRETHSDSGFHIYELVILGRITIYPMEGKCWQSADEILPVDSLSISW
jgi:hypothetical protein